MRLTPSEISIIKKVIHGMDPDARIHLFGSRIRDELKGGDIDLIILSEKLKLLDKLKIRYLLKEKLGERKIDLILTSKPGNAFTRISLKESILL